jgi:hypothetical protein
MPFGSDIVEQDLGSMVQIGRRSSWLPPYRTCTESNRHEGMIRSSCPSPRFNSLLWIRKQTEDPRSRVSENDCRIPPKTGVWVEDGTHGFIQIQVVGLMRRNAKGF